MELKQGYMAKSKSDDWRTPRELYTELDNEFEFNFDPCPINPDFDGLNIEWKQSNFVNPPYSDLAKWIEKSWKEWKKGKTVVMLIPSRTDTIAFHKYIYNQAKIRFLRGRVKFENGGKPQPAPFPSMVVMFINPKQHDNN